MKTKDPLEGVTLKAILTSLVEEYDWDGLGDRIALNCFINDPSMGSSLAFLRKTPWARKKVEKLYILLRQDQAELQQLVDAEREAQNQAELLQLQAGLQDVAPGPAINNVEVSVESLAGASYGSVGTTETADEARPASPTSR